MLTTRVLKRKEGELFDRILSAFRTGMIMTGTSLAATLIAFIFTQSDVIKQIMLILTIGLFFDMLYTWIQNAGILRYYLEKKKKQHHE
jgi:preprotein translocase subunit SecF